MRADRLSVYGHGRPTTPFLQEFARDARVFEDCTSVANSTLPAHASMFTGKMPTEHGVDDEHKFLDDAHETLAEIFGRNDYDTYLYSANPHVAAPSNLSQGFAVEEHPWDEARRERAQAIVKGKIDPRDRSTELRQMVSRRNPDKWYIKACGALAGESFAAWLERRDDPDRPFFAVLNYMEAHQPFVPSPEHRDRMMTPKQVERSMRVNYSWPALWSYTLGIANYEPASLELIGLTYDACLAELDDLFRGLIEDLQGRGLVDDTIVVVVSDHGEHLGGHHMLDHQFSLYQDLLHVPLLVRYPPAMTPGRDAAPVANIDLFPTLLGLTGLEPPADLPPSAVDLRDAEAGRARVAQCPAALELPLTTVERINPRFDADRWRRSLDAWIDGGWKLIRGSDGSQELYELATDPAETRDRADSDPETLARMNEGLDARLATFATYERSPDGAPELSPEQRERLETLGYVGGGE